MKNKLITALANTAEAWRDPEHEPRARAVAETLGAPNRFTEEALTFALNQWMHTLRRKHLTTWARTQETASLPRVVAICCAGAVPLGGLRDVLAALLAGHRCAALVPAASPALLPAFIKAVRHRASDVPLSFSSDEAMPAEADAVIAAPEGEEAMQDLHARCEAAGLGPSLRFIRQPRVVAAVLDGSESPDELEGLAEDALLYEGAGSNSVRLIWAPAGQAPDAVLEAMAQFRAAVPVHPETPGTLEMQRAFLEAADQSHAYGKGLEFLVSRGTPEVQPPGHVRWAEYEELEEARAWIEAEAARLQFVAARAQVAARLPEAVPTQPHGQAHRQPLREARGERDVRAFLAKLDAPDHARSSSK